MRKTVEEKLEGTLERRLGESFKLVSDRLEQVHKGLGEMQSLANGVGDLKKVLSNVRVRGTWGEMQLGNLLEQILAPSQYDKNVATKADSADRVEFAVKLPGRDDADGQVVWLPIDAKFPKEDYERLVEASERADAAAVEAASGQLEVRIRAEAKAIRDKYLDPPRTTDFGILYLATEGLYAEALRRPGLFESLQRDYRVNIAGPTTLAALLNSLQMGFRTLAIQKRSGEVWTLLGAVKTEFRKFGDVIEKVQKKIQEAGNAIESAQVRSRAIERKLKKVEELPAGESAVRLAGGEPEADEDAAEPDGEAGPLT
jgi:DNA recombination protein RmuC